MKTLNSRAPAVDIFALGHRLRWLKQMALRGRARRYDENGMCGKQRLVVACDFQSFMANVGTLFQERRSAPQATTLKTRR